MSSWDDIFWQVDKYLSNYPLLDHWRYAWNRMFSSEVVKIGETRRKYSRFVKYVIAGVIALLLGALSGGIAVFGFCCMSFLSVTGPVGASLSLLALIVTTLVVSAVSGPLFTGLMNFFYRDEVNLVAEPSMVLSYVSERRYRRFLPSVVITFWVASVVSTLVSTLLSTPFLIVRFLVAPVIGIITSTLSLTIWLYLSFFLVHRIESIVAAEGQEPEVVNEEQMVIEVDEEEGAKEVVGIGVELSREDGSSEELNLSEVIRETSIISDELRNSLKRIAEDNLEPMKYAFRQVFNALKLDYEDGSLWKVLLSSLLVSVSSLLLAIPVVLTFPFSVISVYRVLRRHVRDEVMKLFTESTI